MHLLLGRRKYVIAKKINMWVKISLIWCASNLVISKVVCLFGFSLKREKKKFETKKNFFLFFFFTFCREIVLQPSKDLLRKIFFLDCFEKCFVLLHTVCFANLGKLYLLIWWFDLKLETIFATAPVASKNYARY